MIFTVGHSNHSLEHFLQLLAGPDITAIADVRSRPLSSMRLHIAAEHGIYARLIPFPLRAEPRKHVGIEPNTHRKLLCRLDYDRVFPECAIGWRGIGIGKRTRIDLGI